MSPCYRAYPPSPPLLVLTAFLFLLLQAKERNPAGKKAKVISLPSPTALEEEKWDHRAAGDALAAQTGRAGSGHRSTRWG